MTHGEVTPTKFKPFITVRPGPVLDVWNDGADFCMVPLSHREALALIGSLTAAMQMSEETK